MSDLAAVLAEVAERQVRFPVLRSLLVLKSREISLDDDAFAAIARCFERRPTEIRRLAAWVDRLASRAATGEKAHRCVSVSCSAQGAASLWEQIGPVLEELGLANAVEIVHCLDHCDRGPSMAVGEDVYVGRDDEVVTDERPFRSEPFSFEA